MYKMRSNLKRYRKAPGIPESVNFAPGSPNVHSEPPFYLFYLFYLARLACGFIKAATGVEQLHIAGIERVPTCSKKCVDFIFFLPGSFSSAVAAGSLNRATGMLLLPKGSKSTLKSRENVAIMYIT